MPPAWRHRRFPPPLASLLLWAVVACAGALGLAATRLQQLHAAFETDARIVHRLLSQRVVQHDAIMATLALLQPGAAAGDAASAAPLPRLPSVYPQILAVLQRTGQDPWPVPLQAELSAAEATSRRTGHAAMAALDLPAGRYHLVLAGTPASYALQIDLRATIPAEEWPMDRDRSLVRVTLEHGGKAFVVQPGRAGDDAVELHHFIGKGIGFRLRVAVDLHPDEGKHPQADFPPVEDGHVALNDTIILKLAHAPPARRGRHADFLRKRLVAQAPVTLQGGQYLHVGRG